MLGLPDGHSSDFISNQHVAFTEWKAMFKRTHCHEPSAKSAFELDTW